MWQRLLALFLCGMPVLGAGACDGLPAGLPEGPALRDIFIDVPQTLSFRLWVRPGGPAFRIRVLPGWQHGGAYEKPWQHDGVLVHAGDLEVARCTDGKRLQLLPLMAWQPLNFAPTFEAEDINFDGYADLSILTEYAGGWLGRSYWVYDPGSGTFVENELTRELGEKWRGSIIGFDAKKREISKCFLMPGCPVMEPDRYRVENNRAIAIHKEEEVTQAGGSPRFHCTVTVSDLVGGAMRVTKVRRFEAPPEAGK